MKLNDTVKKRIVEVAFIIILSCVLFLSCNHNREITVQKQVSEDSETSAFDTETENDSNLGGENASPDKVSSTQNEERQTKICVYVCGAVINPGLYELPFGSRAMAALESAGGFSADAATDCINLAQYLEDGTMLRIPTLDEAQNGNFTDVSGNPVSVGNSLVNINTAGSAELCSVPGIGESRAKAIVDYREKNGKFNTLEDLMKVPGIKEGIFSKMKEYVTVN